MKENFPITKFVEIFIENVQNNQLHNKRNRFSDIVKKIATYIYIRGGKSLFEFLQANIVLPDLGGLKIYMKNELNVIEENKLRFDELHQYLAANDYPFEVHVFEDGTRITSKVEYCPDTNKLIGLNAPYDPSTGMPFENFHKADSARRIYDSISKFEKATYVQLLLAQPNVPGAKAFLLGIYFTTNNFTAIDVTNRINYMKEEFKNYGIEFLGYGSDGDSKMFCAQKKLIDFGEVTMYGSIELCGNLMAENLGTQDTFHILKRFKNLMNQFSRLMRIGDHIVTVNHLIIMYKKFDKLLHGIVQSDLDVTDFMNYDCLYKITNERVLNLLRRMENTKGTVLYLELIQCGLISFVEHDTTISERLFNAVYMVSFLRFWKTDILKKNLQSETFITASCYEGLEMNLLWLLRLIIDERAHNISENSSQQCESEFRHIRSLTGVQSTQINCSPKIFLSRLHKIELCERIMFELKEDISFPIVEQREQRHRRLVDDFNVNDIDIIIESAIFAAAERAKEMGIYHQETSLKDLLKFSKGRKAHHPVLTNFIINRNVSEWDNEDSDFIDESLILQNVEFPNTRSNDGYISIIESGNIKVIKKDQLVWMLENDKIHVNTDLRQRFVPRRTINISSSENQTEEFWVDSKISKGDSIILFHEGNVLFGTVLNFKRFNFQSKRKSTYYKDYVDIEDCENIGMMLNPLYFIDSGEKVEIVELQFFKVELYKCHVNSNMDISQERFTEHINSLRRSHVNID